MIERESNSNINAINNLFLNDNLKHLLFAFKDEINPERYLSNTKDYIKYFSNGMILISIITYKLYLNWREEQDKNENNQQDYSNSMIRIVCLLESLYNTKKFNYDLIENLLLSLQIDWILDSEDTFTNKLKIHNLFNFPKNSELSKYIYELKKSIISGRYIPKFTFRDLCNFYGMFRSLLDVDVEFKNIEVSNTKRKLSKIILHRKPYSNFGVDLDLGELLYNSNNSLYYLEYFEFIDKRRFDGKDTKDQIFNLNYVNFLNNQTIKISHYNKENVEINNNDPMIIGDTEIEDIFIKYRFIDVVSSQTEFSFFEDYMFFNNKYIKYLALVIADTICTGTKENILNKYTKYSAVFKKFSISNANNTKRWDEIIIFLLLEVGIFDFLSFILENESYERIIQGFRNRFGDKIKTIENKFEIISNPKNGLTFKNKNQLLRNKVNALILLATNLLTFNNETVSNLNSMQSLNDVIDELDYSYNSNLKNIEKIILISNSLIKSLIFLNSFYIALNRYVYVKTINELENNDEDNAFNIDYSEYKNIKQNALNEFINTYKTVKRNYEHDFVNLKRNMHNKREFIEQIKMTIKKVFYDFRKTNENFSVRNSGDNELLYEATGKRYLFKDSEMNEYENKIDGIYKQILQSKLVDSSQLLDLYNVARKFYLYLGYGYNTKNRFFANAIYPIIGNYSNGVLSNDGYKYAYMDVQCLDEKKFDKTARIKMIIDEELDFKENYYCIPNINRIALIEVDTEKKERLWGNPILIPCSVLAPMSTARFEQLNDRNNYDEVSQLIFETDKHIYSSLFGNIENAKKVLPYLYERENNSAKKSIFDKSYIYILKETTNQKDVVVAFASYYEMTEEIVFDRNLIYNAFKKANIELPSTINTALDYFEETFNNKWFGDKIMVCDLAVNKDYRKKGYAKYLLSRIINKAEVKNKDIILTVYADNELAFKLYCSLGFIPFGEDFDNRGENNTWEKYYSMIRYV